MHYAEWTHGQLARGICRRERGVDAAEVGARNKAALARATGYPVPSFNFAKDADNVRQARRELNITYPVALDNNFKIWKSFHNAYWPGEYLIDGTGRVRRRQYGEANEFYGIKKYWHKQIVRARPNTLWPYRKIRRTG